MSVRTDQDQRNLERRKVGMKTGEQKGSKREQTQHKNPYIVKVTAVFRLVNDGGKEKCTLCFITKVCVHTHTAVVKWPLCLPTVKNRA